MHLGIDIGGTNIKHGILNDNSELLEDESEPTNSIAGVEDVIFRLIKIISYYTEKYDVKTVGIGVPGVVSPEGIVIVAPNMKDWINIPLRERLTEKFDFNFAIDNDANAAAIAEMVDGAGKGISHFLYVTLGTGVGAGIVSDGKLFKGETGSSGEIGHVIIDAFSVENKKRKYRTGVLETYTGRKEIIEFGTKFIKNHPDSSLHQLGNKLDVKDFADHARNGDKAAELIIKRTGFLLGIGITNALNLLDLRTVVVGGGVANSGRILLDEIENTIKERALPNIADNIKVLQAHFRKDTGIYGAALLGKLYS
jgi:glucokinase